MKVTTSRNLYFLAATLFLFSIVAGIMSLLPNPLQPGLPVNGSQWKMIGLVLLLASLGTSLAGMLTAVVQQVERRNQERMRRELQEGLPGLRRPKNRK